MRSHHRTQSMLSILAVVVLVACATAEEPVLSLTGGSGVEAGEPVTGGAGGSGGATGGMASGGESSGGLGVGGGGTGGTTDGGGATGGGGSETVSCSDGIRNGTESDVDCGGTCALKCAEGQRCDILVDCADGLACYGPAGSRTCSHCGNGVLDGDETDVDCGPTCGGCLGAACDAANPCAHPIQCDAGGLCSHCGNGVQDGDETGEDCGGSCLRCDGDACTAPADCAIGDCYLELCQPTPCLAGWRDSEAGQSCLSQTQGDRAECAAVLDCCLENGCSPAACGQSTCRPPSGGMAGVEYATPVYSALCG